MRWKVLAIVVLLAVAGAAIGVSTGLLKPSTAAATTFLTAAVTTSDVTDEVTATGTVASSWTYALAFGSAPTAAAASAASNGSSSSSSSSSSASGGVSVTWPVSDVAVQVGDRVTQGQILATAGTADLEAQIADATRAARTALLQQVLAKGDYDAASGTQATRQAEIQLNNATSSRVRADADLASLTALRPYATLTAPADGVVTAVALTKDVDAPSGTAITIQSAALLVTTSVVESDVSKITVGQKASITIAAINATLQGAVSTIAPTSSSSGNNGVVEYAVEIALDAPPAALRPGMSADVSVVTATASGVLAVPSRALSGTAGSYTVRVVAADGSVETRDVTVGLVTSSLAEIKSGVQAGERVVTGTSSTQQTNATNRGVFGGGAGAGGQVIVPGR